MGLNKFCPNVLLYLMRVIFIGEILNVIVELDFFIGELFQKNINRGYLSCIKK
jgi:hypothetical protein